MSRLVSVNVGLPREVIWKGRAIRTGIWKEPNSGHVLATREGLEGDGQGDPVGHGGSHRAVLVYQLSAYRHWAGLLGTALDAHGQFGENFTVDGLEDSEVCIGDRFRIGEAEFEVSQPRVTCFKLDIRLQQRLLPALMVEHGRPGFYLRVIAEGRVQAGDEIHRIGRGQQRMTVVDIDALLYKPGHPSEKLESALAEPALSPGWRGSFNDLLEAAQSGGIVGNPGLVPKGNRLPAWSGFVPLQVVDIRDESDDVRSLTLASPDGVPLPPFRAGQSLAVRLSIDGSAIIRMYSLTGDGRTGNYRIGVKHHLDGAASNFLHRQVQSGDVIEASAPRGSFTLSDTDRPVVLLSAGIGLTPLLAMLGELACAVPAPTRPVWWIHSARNSRHHPFRAETTRLIKQLPKARSHIVYSRPLPDDKPGKDFDETGHLSLTTLAGRRVPQDADFYLCGPAEFLASMLMDLRWSWKVEPGRIHVERFAGEDGRGQQSAGGREALANVGVAGPRVTFARSGVTVRWSESQASLLELAEAAGVPARWSCRSGVCQSCECPLIDGQVTYSPEPIATPNPGSILLCCARPIGDVELDI